MDRRWVDEGKPLEEVLSRLDMATKGLSAEKNEANRGWSPSRPSSADSSLSDGALSEAITPRSDTPPRTRRMWRTCVFCGELFNHKQADVGIPSVASIPDTPSGTPPLIFEGKLLHKESANADGSVARGVCRDCEVPKVNGVRNVCVPSRLTRRADTPKEIEPLSEWINSPLQSEQGSVSAPTNSTRGPPSVPWWKRYVMGAPKVGE